jgi:hypothetical protein
MKIAIITAVHGRHDVTRLCFERLYRVIQSCPYDVRVYVSGNDYKHRVLAVDLGFQWVDTSNHWVSKKFNNALLHAKLWQPDYVMTLGSDDLLHPDLFLYCSDSLRNGVEIFGFNRMIVWEPLTGRKKLFNGYDNPKTLGACRFYSAEVCGHFDWELWPWHKNHGLDTAASKLCNIAGFTETLIDAPPLFVDIKTGESLNKFDTIPGEPTEADLSVYIGGLQIPKNWVNLNEPTQERENATV